MKIIDLQIKKPSTIHLFSVIVTSAICFLSVLHSPTAGASSTAGFEAGNIMNDAVMSNKHTMTQAQIQSFLNNKNNCKTNPKNTSVLTHINSTGTYGYLIDGNGTKFKYYLKNSRFICMADQDFNGESAARIIYRAAQDYTINPQVLIVLLQKENGLITDNWPNYNFQYATATGYACPDSGPNNSANCNSNYFGFKNQVRHAASMFRTLLNGQGFNNYPVGNNRILYNPASSCGSSIVNVKNRATGALYTYTPYQPNSAVLKRSWPIIAPYPACGAYGNLNFYAYFTQWFGSTQKVFRQMQKPRYMISAIDQYKKYPVTDETDTQLISKNQVLYFDQVVTINGVQYLRSSWDTNHGEFRGIPRNNLKEFEFKPMQTPRYMTVIDNQSKVYPIENKTDTQVISNGREVYFDQAVTVNGIKYLRSAWDTSHKLERAIPINELSELEFKPMQTPRYLKSKIEQNKIQPITQNNDDQVINQGRSILFNQIMIINGVQYLRSTWDTENNLTRAIPRDSLEELEFKPMKTPRYMKAASEQNKLFPVTDGVDEQVIDNNQAVFFNESMVINNAQYLRSSWDSSNNFLRAIPRNKLSELKYEQLATPRHMKLTKDQYKVNPVTREKDSQLLKKGTVVYFSQVIEINSVKYLRSNWDEIHNLKRAIPITRLMETSI